MYVLDTNVVSEIRRAASGRAEQRVIQWALRVEPALTYISVVTFMELEIGVQLVERRDEPSGVILRRWLEDDVRAAFEGRTLPVDIEVARIAAQLHVPDPAPVSDALIAATAMAHSMTVVTRNTSDFSRFDGLDVLNPWIED
ncbi:type II toxin-antitoxin system VapC family toxin [Candidatus Poriferisodalis sp.]|uniref:type II toxin-antitoxin system VapC family toxin n=1 Tax=Candidatus Poriferisodalis sp. TaxID=3101277 RepID=UPI003B02022F